MKFEGLYRELSWMPTEFGQGDGARGVGADVVALDQVAGLLAEDDSRSRGPTGSRRTRPIASPSTVDWPAWIFRPAIPFVIAPSISMRMTAFMPGRFRWCWDGPGLRVAVDEHWAGDGRQGRGRLDDEWPRAGDGEVDGVGGRQGPHDQAGLGLGEGGKGQGAIRDLDGLAERERGGAVGPVGVAGRGHGDGGEQVAGLEGLGGGMGPPGGLATFQGAYGRGLGAGPRG